MKRQRRVKERERVWGEDLETRMVAEFARLHSAEDVALSLGVPLSTLKWNWRRLGYRLVRRSHLVKVT